MQPEKRIIILFIIIVLFNSTFTYAQENFNKDPTVNLDDKMLHFLGGFAVSIGVVGMFYTLTPDWPEWTETGTLSGFGIGVGVLTGGIKEVYDCTNPAEHSAEFLDFLHTLLGALVGGIIVEGLITSGKTVSLPSRLIGFTLLATGATLGFIVLNVP